jgi:lysophospholipase
MLGVLPGYDLTHEAAFAKLLWLVSRKDLSFGKRQRIFQAPVCGEMSVGNGPGGLVPRAE